MRPVGLGVEAPVTELDVNDLKASSVYVESNGTHGHSHPRMAISKVVSLLER